MNKAETPPRDSSPSGRDPQRFQGWQAGDLIADRWFVHKAPPLSQMSVIYFCFDTALGQPVVVKTLPQRYLPDDAARKRFVTECESWINIPTHPNIAKPYFVESVLGYPYVFVEWIEGEDIYHAGLDALVGSPALTIERAVHVMAQVCSGLAHATTEVVAGRQIIAHRDIKPSNILLTRDWTAKITDFGIARTRLPVGGDHTRDERAQSFDLTSVDTSFLGTPPYMSPEHFVNPASVDTRSDIYSLGCTLFEALTGHHVFEAGSWEAWQAAHLHQKPPRASDYRSDVPKDLVETVDACLAKNPADRIQSFSELRERLVGSPESRASEGLAADAPIVTRKRQQSVEGPEAADEIDQLKSAQNRAFDQASDLVNHGDSLDSLGQHREALVCYEEAERLLEGYPLDDRKRALEVVLASNCALAHENLQEYQAALLQRDRAIAAAEALPENYRSVRLSVDKATVLLEKTSPLSYLGEHEQAIELCRKMLTRHPDHKAAIGRMGWLLFRAQRPEEAIPWLRRAVELDDRDMHSLTNLAGALREVGRMDEARNVSERAVQLGPAHPQALYQLGTLLLKTDEPKKAVPYLEKAVSIAPNDSDCWNHLGIALLQSGATGYRKCFENAARMNPKHNAAFGNLVACIGRDRACSAVEAFAEAAISVGLFSSETEVAQNLYRRGQYGETLTLVDHLLSKDPHNAELIILKATSLYEMGRSREAMGLLEKLVTEGAGDLAAMAYHNLGAMAADCGNIRRSVMYYRLAIENGSDRAETWWGLAATLYQSNPAGEADQALHYLQRAIQLQPNFASAYGLRGRILDDMNRNAEALEDYDRALALSPGMPGEMFGRGLVLLKLHRPLDAARAFEEVYRLNPSTTEAAANQALALAIGDRAAEAQAVLSRALAAHPNSRPLLMAAAQLARIPKQDR